MLPELCCINRHIGASVRRQLFHMCAFRFFFCPSPFGGSTVLETYSSTTSRAWPRTRGNRSAARCLCTVLRRTLYTARRDRLHVRFQVRFLARKSIENQASRKGGFVQLLSRYSCVPDRLLVAVRIPHSSASKTQDRVPMQASYFVTCAEIERNARNIVFR